MGIRPRVAKHLWENRHNNQMDLIPYDQDKRIMETQIAVPVVRGVKTKMPPVRVAGARGYLPRTGHLTYVRKMVIFEST